MIGLIAVDWKIPGVPDDAACARHIQRREADDRRVIACRDVDIRRSDTEAVPEFSRCPVVENVRPGEAQVLLPVVLLRLLPDDDVLGIAKLMRPLVAAGDGLALTHIPIDSTGIIVVRKIDAGDADM